MNEPQESAPLEAEWRALPGHVEHTFTHFHLELDVWRAEAITDGVLRDDGDYRWTAREDSERRGAAHRHAQGGGACAEGEIAFARIHLAPA